MSDIEICLGIRKTCFFSDFLAVLNIRPVISEIKICLGIQKPFFSDFFGSFEYPACNIRE